MPEKERQQWPIAQRDGPAIPFGGDDATNAFLGADGRIEPQVHITPRNEVLTLPPQYTVGIKRPGLKTDNDISRAHFSSSPGFHREQVADLQRGKHAVAPYPGSRLSEFLKDLQKKLVPCLLNRIGAHSRTLHSSWGRSLRPSSPTGDVIFKQYYAIYWLEALGDVRNRSTGSPNKM